MVTSAGPALPSLSIAATDAIKAEGDLGTTDFTFTVTRAGDTSIATDVLFDVLPGASNPAAATDFGGSFPVDQLVHFDVGATMQIVTVQVSGDVDIEANEEFTVLLHSPTAGAVISVDTATGTIQDDDAPPSAVLLSDNFDDGDFAGWTVVDEGTVSGPSAWSVVGQEVHQASNIYGFSGSQLDHRDGTTLFWNDAAAQSWQDYTVEASFRSTDDDGIGLVFYYTDADNYYKVDFDQQRGFSTLFQVQGGVETTLATVSGAGYVIGNTTQLAVTVSGSGITVLRDGGDVFGGPVLNGALTSGTVGLYSWGNTGANFDNVVVTSAGPALPSLSIAATVPVLDDLQGVATLITGTAGDDILTGTAGNDVILPGDNNGDDLIVGTTGDDLIDFGTGQGYYTLDYGNLTGPIIVDLGLADSQIIKGAGGVDGVDTLLNANTISSEGLAINGTDSDDTLNGGDGDDLLVGDIVVDGGDVTIDVVEAFQTSGGTFDPNAFNDVINGGDGIDTIYGDFFDLASAMFFSPDGTLTITDPTTGSTITAFEDTIDGGAGADEIWGQLGDDMLTGGLGADTFKYGDPEGGVFDGEGMDTILDFADAEADTVDLDKLFDTLGGFADADARAADVTLSGNVLTIGSNAGFSITFGGTSDAFADQTGFTDAELQALGINVGS